MKRLIVLMGLLFITGIGLADEIEQNDYLYLTCNNATDGTLLCSAATLTCYNSSDTKTVDADAATNIATGQFKFQYTNTTDRYGCFIDCCTGAVDYAFPVYVTTTPIATAELTSIETAISQNTTSIATAISQNTTDIKGNLTGIETAISQNKSAIITQGDSAWISATGYETETNAGGRYDNLSANMTDIVEHGDSDWDTATGFETEASASTRYDNLKANMTDVVEHGDSGWITATGFATLTNATTILDTINALTDVSASQVWSYATRVLTNISVVAPDIYGYFTEGSNEDVFKADVSNLATTANLNQNISGVIEHGDNHWNSSTVSIAGLATQVNLTDGVVVLTSATETQIDDIDTNVGYVLSNQSTLHSEINGVTDEVWDELLTGATHNLATSAGRRLRQIAGFAIRTETAQDGTVNTIVLDASASSTDGIYNRDFIVLTEGTGVGQTRIITEYNGTTKNATINRDWKITPDATSVFQILANDVEGHPNHGYAQAGGETNITLEGAASSTDDIYNGDLLYISTGTGAEQARLITDYNGTTKVAKISPNWLTQPDTTSVYHIDYGVRVNVETNYDKTGYSLSAAGVDSIWNEDISGWSVTGYAGTYLKIVYDNQSSFVTATGFSSLQNATDIRVDLADLDTSLNQNFTQIQGNLSDVLNNQTTLYNEIINVETAITQNTTSLRTSITQNTSLLEAALNLNFTAINNNFTDVLRDTGNILSNQSTLYLEINEISGEVWDENQTDHNTSGTYGNYLDQRVSQVTVSGTTPSAVYDHFTAEGRALNESSGWMKNESEDIDNSLTNINANVTEIYEIVVSGGLSGFSVQDSYLNSAFYYCNMYVRLMESMRETKLQAVNPDGMRKKCIT